MPLSQTELKKLKSLLTRKGRQTHRKFLAEGVRLLEEAMRHHLLPTVIYSSPSMLPSRGQTVVNRFNRVGVTTVTVSPRQLRALADTETPQGIVGLFARPTTALGELYHSRYRRFLLCENVSDPGNLGTLIRSALAFGFDMVLTIGSSAEPYAPKVVRSSAGAVFGLPIATVSRGELERLLTNERIVLIASGTDATRTRGLPARMAARRLILAIGSEAAGLSADLKRCADYWLRIEHSDKVDSLNAAVAGSIIMKQIYEMST